MEPWMTPYIPDLKKETNKTIYQHRKSGQNEDYNAFGELRNKPRRNMRIPYLILKKKIDEDKGNPKLKTKLLNHIKYIGKKQKQRPGSMIFLNIEV